MNDPRFLGDPALNAAAFKRQQHTLDRLIDETENLVMVHAPALPGRLRTAIGRSLAEMHGRVPPWVDQIARPVDMLDQLFMAEGRLRQRYYTDRCIELDDAG